MSDLFRQSVNKETPPRPRPQPIHPASLAEVDEHPRSDSSSSSADSAASVVTVRPSSREQPAPASASHWTNYFGQELFLTPQDDSVIANYHVYLTPPRDVKKGPLFVCHHGAGASGLSFAVFAKHIRAHLPFAGTLSLEARGHGSVVKDSSTDKEILDYSLATLTSDALKMITLTQQQMSWPTLPPIVLVGHSLGGAVVTSLASLRGKALDTALVGYTVLDVVEGSALEALSHMKTYLSSRPTIFLSTDEAIAWHTRTRTIRNAESASVSVPSLLIPSPDGTKQIWRTDLGQTSPFWSDWFTGMSHKFLTGRGAKMLILAGTDRLDKDLMIGQMQGKFQLVVLPEAGHFVQEDVPEKVAELAAEFWRRNDRGSLVLPPKVSDLLAQGKKV